MRDAFFSELADLFRADSRVIFLTADLGYKLYDPLIEIDAHRVINTGIREAAMVGFAAGLAKGGMLPFIYSIVPFLVLRCLEQIKLDLCYNNSRVVIVGVGGGYAYGPNGPTHHGVEDIGVLSCLPNLRIWTPCDPLEVRACVQETVRLSGPAYLRLGRNGEKNLHKPGRLPQVERPVVLAGNDKAAVTVITCGPMASEVLRAAEIAGKQNLSVRVVHVPTLRPFPEKSLKAFLANGAPVVTVEEHVAAGGLGQAVAAIIAGEQLGNRLKILAVPDVFQETCQSRPASLAWAGLDAESIAAACKEFEI